MLIPLDQIDPPANPLRRVANPEADASLTASIAARGVLTPILVTRAGNRYRLLDGAARLRCAQAAGIATIPAEITDMLSPEAEQAATAAVNIVRATVAPVDQWRAIVAMQQAGSTLANATASLGLSEQMGRRLDHLGRLHPDVLALIEAAGMPDYRHLRVIAQASHKQQKTALKSTRATPEAVDWYAIARACTTQRIPRSRAIFDPDTAGITWDEDLLAEPGSDEQWTTQEVTRFLAAQREALAAQVEASRGRMRMGEPDTDSYRGFRVPKGWREKWGDKEKPKRNQVIFVGFPDAGASIGEVFRVLASNPKADAERAKKRAEAKATPADDDDPGEDDDAGDDTPDEPAPPPPEPTGITKAGLQMIADAKTLALRAALIDPSAPHSLDTLLLIAVLAIHGDNVAIRRYSNDYEQPSRRHGTTLSRLVTPDGMLDWDDQTLTETAATVLAKILGIDGPVNSTSSYNRRSGAPGEWIGRAIMAEHHLPRFDTPEFVATCNSTVLRQAAESAGLKPAKTTAALRTQIAGNAPDWRPTQAQFGAAGPTPRDADDDDGDEESADE